MDIVLLSEVIKEQDLWAYPYNALRNHALSRADTDVSHLSAVWFHTLMSPHSKRSRQQLRTIILLDPPYCASTGV